MSEITLSTVPCDSSGIRVRGAAAPAESSRQTVLVFQGGGALGAYQVGVYQALHEASVESDWVIGTSIGAINASLIAGNRREDKLDQMNAFWKRVQNAPCLAAASNLPWLGAAMPNLATLLSGISGFFQPNLLAFLGLNTPLARGTRDGAPASTRASTRSVSQGLGAAAMVFSGLLVDAATGIAALGGLLSLGAEETAAGAVEVATASDLAAGGAAAI